MSRQNGRTVKITASSCLFVLPGTVHQSPSINLILPSLTLCHTSVPHFPALVYRRHWRQQGRPASSGGPPLGPGSSAHPAWILGKVSDRNNWLVVDWQLLTTNPPPLTSQLMKTHENVPPTDPPLLALSQEQVWGPADAAALRLPSLLRPRVNGGGADAAARAGCGDMHQVWGICVNWG